MRKLLYLTLASALVGSSGYYFSTNYVVDGLESVSVSPIEDPDGQDPASNGDSHKRQRPDSSDGQPPRRHAPIGPIKIASFHLDRFDARKLGDDDVIAHLIEVIRTFDVVAVQDVRSRTEGALVELTEKINTGKPHYNFVAPEHVAQGATTDYCAFLFNEATVQVDRNSVLSVQDLGDRLSRRPLVASFICQQPTTEAAFTFSLVNVHLDAQRFDEQLDILADVFRAVRDSSGGEDDVILLGNLGGYEGDFGRLTKLPNMIWMVSDQPTTSQHTLPVDNLFFNSRATSEFTGRGGVKNLMTAYTWGKKDSSAAAKVSKHSPVWAEFSPFEGGRSAPVATGPREESTR